MHSRTAHWDFENPGSPQEVGTGESHVRVVTPVNAGVRDLPTDPKL